MKKSILLFLTMLWFNSIIGQINNQENPGIAPNSGVQTPTTGAQTTRTDFQPTAPYISTVPSVTPVVTMPDMLLTPSTQSVTPQIQTQPSSTNPNSSGTDNSLYASPTNTLNPGAPTSPPKQ